MAPGARAPSSALEIAPDPGLLATARLFAAAVVRRSGRSDEAVEDVKLAVSEACTRAIRRLGDGEPSARLRLEATDEGGRLVFSVAAPAGRPPAGSATDDALDDVDLVAALFEDAREETSGGVTTVTFSLPDD